MKLGICTGLVALSLFAWPSHLLAQRLVFIDFFVYDSARKEARQLMLVGVEAEFYKSATSLPETKTIGKGESVSFSGPLGEGAYVVIRYGSGKATRHERIEWIPKPGESSRFGICIAKPTEEIRIAYQAMGRDEGLRQPVVVEKEDNPVHGYSVGTETVEGDPFANLDFLEDDSDNVPPKDSEPGIDDYVAIERQPEWVNKDTVIKSMAAMPELRKAREAGINGQVVVRILVDRYGNYVKHKVLRSPHPVLTAVVEAQVSKLKFTPGISAGKPIMVWVNVPFRF